MAMLKNLHGTTKPKIAVYVKDGEAALRAIKIGRGACAAGDYGAISAWRDDDGLLRAEVQVYCSTVKEFQTKSKPALAKFVTRWIKKVHEGFTP